MSELENEQPQKSGVRGWLLVLCLALTIIAPLTSLYSLITTYNEISQISGIFEVFPGLKTVLYIDGFLSVVLMILCVRAGLALWTIKPNAVKIAKNYLLIFLGYSVVAIFLPYIVGLPTELTNAMIPETIRESIRSFIFFGIWYTYLNVSERVKATYRLEISDDSGWQNDL